MVNLSFPWGGVSNADAFSRQRRYTTRDAQNVRNTCPIKRTLSGAARAGMRKHTQALLEAAGKKVSHLCELTYDNRHVTYANLSPLVADIVWSRESPAATDTRAVAIDRQGNVYVVNANAGVSKFNNDGTLQWSFSLPAKDRAQVCRALAVDSSDRVYVAVSAGGNQLDARIWCLKQGAEQSVAVAWEIIPGAFVEAFAQFGGKLYTVQNSPDRFLAEVVIYSSITTSVPKEVQRWETAYPCNDIAVKSDGSVFTASPPFADRGKDPRFPGFTQRTVDWRMERDLDSVDKRLWLNLRGRFLLDEQLAEDDDVTFWPENSGNDRNLKKDPNALAPTFNLRGIASEPVVRFDGANVGGGAALTSEPNQSIAAAQADQQKTIIPTYTGARWVMFLLIRAPHEDTTPRSLFAWDNGVTTAITNEKNLLTNRASNATVTAGGALGLLSWYEATMVAQPGAGAAGPAAPGPVATGNMPIEACWNQVYTGAAVTAATALGSGLLGQVNGCALITIGCDGGSAVADPAFHSFLRINGKPMDRWRSFSACEGLNVSRFGLSFVAALTNLYQGEIVRVVVLRDWPDISPATDVVLTHPKYPRTVGTVGGAGTSQNVAWSSASDTELERIEGEIMHEARCSHLLPGGVAGVAPANVANNPTYAAFVPTVTPPATLPDIGHFPHPYHQKFGPPREGGVAVESQPFLLHSVNGVLAKFSPTGQVVWVVTNRVANATPSVTFPAVELGGIGYGVRVNSLGEVYSTGPMFDTTSAEKGAVIRKIIDLGSTYSTSSGGAWSKRVSDFATVGVTDSLNDQYVKMAVDTFDNVFLPIQETNIANFTATLAAFSRTGTALFTLGGGNSFFEADTGAACPQGLAVVVDPRVPEYQTGGPTRAQYFYVVTDRGRVGSGGPVAGTPTIYKVPTVTVTATTGSARTLVRLGVTDGKIRKFSVTRNSAGEITGSVQSSPAGVGTLVQPELNPTADWYSSVDLLGYRFFVDGKFARYYDPKLDVVKPWESTTGGRMPPAARLVDAFLARAVLARGPDDPHNLHLSAQGKPFDFDFRPAVPTVGQAVDLAATSDAGRCPRPINALLGLGDDLLVAGCDSAIIQLTGEPLAGGRWDDISTTVGMAFGKPFARDPKGVVYFVSDRGGLFVWVPGATPEPVSDEALMARLSAFDFQAYAIQCEWNVEFDGLHICQTPYAHSGFAQAEHWFWERRTGRITNGALWPDRYGNDANPGLQPGCLMQSTSVQPFDRRMLMGCLDGYVREFDAKQTSDDGVAVDSMVVLGPIIPPDGREFIYKGVDLVLSSDQTAELNWEFYVTNTPDKFGAPEARGIAGPGRNEGDRFTTAGVLGYVVLRSADALRRWALEDDVVVEARMGGRRRVR